jgi:hypothetical protein
MSRSAALVCAEARVKASIFARGKPPDHSPLMLAALMIGHDYSLPSQ